MAAWLLGVALLIVRDFNVLSSFRVVMAEQSNAPNTLVVVDTEEWRRVKTRQYNKDYKRKRNAMKPKNRKGPMPKPETTARMSEGAPNCHAARQRNYRERASRFS